MVEGVNAAKKILPSCPKGSNPHVARPLGTGSKYLHIENRVKKNETVFLKGLSFGFFVFLDYPYEQGLTDKRCD
jgi:hypothetical protein